MEEIRVENCVFERHDSTEANQMLGFLVKTSKNIVVIKKLYEQKKNIRQFFLVVNLNCYTEN